MNTHKVLVTLSEEMFKFVKAKTERIGVSIQEYVRHLIVKDKENDR